MSQLTVGIVSPGAMGSALGRVWRRGGARVVCTVAGRSARTHELAAGLELLAGLDEVVAASDVLVSVAPPGAALSIASAIAAQCRGRSRRLLVADLNAIAPSTVRQVAAILEDAGCDVVDGSISGAPPTATSATRLYLSGRSAAVLADLDAPGLLSQVVGTEIGTASAVKMCTASVYKGFNGLLLRALQTARANGVTDLVMADLQAGLGISPEHAAGRIAVAAAKSDRFPAEMREIATTQSAAGTDTDLFEAMARLFEAVAGTKLGAASPEQAARPSDLDAVLAALEPASHG